MPRTPPPKARPVEYCDYCQQSLGLTEDDTPPLLKDGQFVLCAECVRWSSFLVYTVDQIKARIPAEPGPSRLDDYTKQELWALMSYENIRAETAVNRMEAMQAAHAKQPRKPKGPSDLTKAILAERANGAPLKDLVQMYMKRKHVAKLDEEQAREAVKKTLQRHTKGDK